MDNCLNHVVELHNGKKTIFINGTPFDSHEIIKELGRGMNGVVYLAINCLLERKEAIKIWGTLRAGDRRDKAKQGLAEIRKLANANSEYSVEVFFAQIFDGVPLATMEFIEGKTLRQWASESPRSGALIQLAYSYLEAIEGTTTKNSRHGDPHLSNVLAYTYSPDLFVNELRVKLCDFGTSIFSGQEASKVRHWRIVEESILLLTRGLQGASEAKLRLAEFKGNLKIDVEQAYGSLTDRQVAQLRNIPLRNYLSCLSDYRPNSF